VTFVDVAGWDQPGGGPGTSLLAARPHVEGDLTFTSCDTLWAKDLRMWHHDYAWAATAPIPAGTSSSRWCRMNVREVDSRVVSIIDKESGFATQAYTGLAHVPARLLDSFWQGVEGSGFLNNERQVTGGLRALLTDEQLYAMRIAWIDVGDEDAYRTAIARVSGYDWIKPGQATYIIPSSGRVVKFFANPMIVARRVDRGRSLGDLVPQPIEVGLGGQMFSYPYAHGSTGYEAAEKLGPRFVEEVIKWTSNFKHLEFAQASGNAARLFYFNKTNDRIAKLSPQLQNVALDAIHRVPWPALYDGTVPGVFHGDLNFGNIVWSEWASYAEPRIVGIDWREDFAGEWWGDLRYDRAKLMAGCVVHWERARHGDFRPWVEGKRYLQAFRDAWRDPTVEIIAALSLFNSAPLHAAPLDEVLVARGAAWLQEVIK
jgi:hypothetical protein